MILVGLTGGIGSGKSTVINHFKELGVKRIIAPSAVGSLKENFQPGNFVSLQPGKISGYYLNSAILYNGYRSPMDRSCSHQRE